VMIYIISLKLTDLLHSLARASYQWLSAASHVTRQSSSASVCWHHGSSSKQCCTVFQILSS